jgi:formylglycine-generating enzyme required for sulfatase activity
MAHVYRARDKILDRIVAVKILTEQSTADSEAKARFLREAKTAGNIDHENIIHIYDFGVNEGRPYMVMEFLRGQDLRQALTNQQTGDMRNRLDIARGLARALGHIHSVGIVHRDIKPENVHIDQAGKVKLMDFGIAKSLDLNLTRPGFTLGTPSYMAPEQVRGQEITPLVDIYAWGLLLYELITGNKPIQAKTIQEIFQKILTQEIDLAPLTAADASPAVIDLVKRCISKNPAERPQNFAAIVQELDYIIYEMDGGTPNATAYGTSASGDQTAQGRPAWLIPAIAGGVLVLLLIACFALRQKDGDSTSGKSGSSSPPAGMILIPAGAFLFGPNKASVDLPNFFIDRTEVTVADYAKFCEAVKRPAPPGNPADPVSNVTVDEAREYARWAGKRLPTPQEWEKAARGSAGNLYPWGDQHEPRNAVVADNPDPGLRSKQPADSMPQSASFYGVRHMAGNVREYVVDFRTPTPEQVQVFARVLSPSPTAAESWVATRGGSYDKPLPKEAVMDTMLVPVRYAGAAFGFRCVKDAD